MTERPDLLHLEPPFPAELLADLHAGVLPDDVAARLWPLVHADPAAEQVISALDAVTDDLSRLGPDDTDDAASRNDTAEPIPPLVAAQIRRALLDEPVHSADPGARSRRRRLLLSGGAVAAGIAAVVAVVVGIGRTDAPGPVVAAPQSHVGADRGAVDLGSDVTTSRVLHFRGTSDLGPLADPALRGACLSANGLAPDAPILGSGSVVLRGIHGTLLLLPGARPPALTALVVGDHCGQGTTDVLAVKHIGIP